ncbi:MAG: Crp/Fnr family transcriptional regulator [Gemmatimonadota bacterium]
MARREIAAHELLANVTLFRQLDAASRARIAAHASKLRLRRGEFAFHRGDAPTGFFVVVYGEIALSASGARGPRLTGLVGPGRSFGEPMMFLAKPYIVDARAHTDALLLVVPKDAVFAEIERNPAFAYRMIAGLAARIETLVHELDAQARGSARERLIDYLLRAAGVREGATTVTLPMSKVALASQLGLTAEHLSRLLRDLTERKLIRVERRRIAIADAAALARVRRRGAASG